MSDSTMMRTRVASPLANQLLTARAKVPVSAPEKKPKLVPEALPIRQHGCQHWAYASALRDIYSYDDPERLVGRKGARLLMEYPMKEDTKGKVVLMRCKTVDETTGQMAYTWIVVYETDNSEYCVGDFAFTP